MMRTLVAVIDEMGRVKLLEDLSLPVGSRVLVTVLEDATDLPVAEVTLLSEAALAEDWGRPEEDLAWEYLQSVR